MDLGKSTILNQFELISGRQYTQDERMDYRDVILSNAVQSMQVSFIKSSREKNS
jgi:guanine nucleotide-binding protein G(i) subunit alpha